MMGKVTSKADMYARLTKGEFGNTIRQWFSLLQWYADGCAIVGTFWGVRSLKATDPRCRLDVPAWEVPLVVANFKEGEYNISEMVDPYAVLRAEVMRLIEGLYVYYVPPGCQLWSEDKHPWRDRFKRYGKHSYRLEAKLILQHYLWPSDYEDLLTLLDNMPEHVIELSACNRAVGVIPHRNTCIWEVRPDDGSYEKWL